MKPYKVISDGPGEADVIHRETDKRVGYLRQNYHEHWSAYLTSTPGWALPFGWFDWRDDEDRTARVLVEGCGYQWAARLTTRYRDDAAARVWEAHMEGR